MASFDTVNYSLRPSKTIQRNLIFEAVRMLQAEMALEEMVYVGFGSIWFTDFQMAHRALNIRDMISIEGDEIGFHRAQFNKPYKTVEVLQGLSAEVLPQLLSKECLLRRPWLIWLDYDRALEESSVEDIRLIIENAPPNSIFLGTFSGSGGGYGNVPQRADRIKTLLGRVVPDDLSKEDCKEEHLHQTLLRLTGDFMATVAADSSRPGGFLKAFGVLYRDGTPMITAGGVLPAKGAVPAVRAIINREDWPGIVSDPIVAPHLTLKEASLLQSQLPSNAPLDRAAVQGLGFDLEEGQIRAFEKYYKYYPAFAQVLI